MSITAIELPLFPLSLVLFPGTVRPLHIFEPRYRQMIRDCVLEDKPFGIVLLKDGEHLAEEPYTVGTMATIHNLHKLEDGGYNLMAVGTQRFRILDRHRHKSYLSGLVEPFTDDPEDGDQLVTTAWQARNHFITYLNMLVDAPEDANIEENLPAEFEDLSHFIACFLEVEDKQKQSYLELTSTLQRLHAEIAFLRREIPFMRQILFKEPSKERIVLN